MKEDTDGIYTIDENNFSDNMPKPEYVKVTFEIDKNMLNVAAGLIAMQSPEDYNDLMDFAVRCRKNEIFINKDLLQRFAKENANYTQIPLFVAIMAFMKIIEE